MERIETKMKHRSTSRGMPQAFIQVSGRVAARTISFWSRLVAVNE
jgi:hypothetical protein